MRCRMIGNAKKICKIGLYVSLFYIISLTLGFFSSYVYSKKNYNFRFPLFITSMQNILHFILSTICIWVIKRIFRVRNKNRKNQTHSNNSKKSQQKSLEDKAQLENHMFLENKFRPTHSQPSRVESSHIALTRSLSLPTIHEFTKTHTNPNHTPSQENFYRKYISEKGQSVNIDQNRKYETAHSETGKIHTKNTKPDLSVDTESKNGVYRLTQSASLDSLNINNFHKKLRVARNSESEGFSHCRLHKKKNRLHVKSLYIDNKNYSEFGSARQVLLAQQMKNNKTSHKGITETQIFSYIATTLTCAITAAIDIGLSSHALRTVSLAFYTMIKSSAPVFVLLSGFLFGIEQPSIKLFLTIFTIGAGVFLTTIKADTVTHTVNLCLNVTTFSLFFASFMGGFRWAFVQYLIEKRRVAKRSILYTIKELCLPISILLFIFSCYFEGIRNIMTSEFFRTRVDIQRNIAFIVLSGFLSFCLLVSEFLLVSETSVVFLSVAGIVKELIIVFVSVCKKEIRFDPINYGGLTVSILGMLFYNVLMITRRSKKELKT